MPPSPSPQGDVGGGGQGFGSSGVNNSGPAGGQAAAAAAAPLDADIQPSVAAGAVAAPPGVAGNIPKDIVAVRRNGRHICYST